MQQEETTCLLCSEQAKIIGLGICNHKHICHICTIKMRQKCKDISCPICKQKLEKIIFTDQLDSEFNDFNLGELIKDKDLYFDQEETKYVVEQLNQLKCFVIHCKEGSLHHNSMLNLKKHLKEKHSRVLCEICLEFRTCVLNEQIIYSQYQLSKHQNKGDFDEDGNIKSFHPHCQYCSKLFYDEDKFRFHLNDAHINCSICSTSGTQYKYRYYKDHGEFERHLRNSHYMCEQAECVDSLAAFQSQAELENHQARYHGYDIKGRKTINQASIQQFVGFYREEEGKNSKQFNKPDLVEKEGHNFEDQFISLLKTRLGGIVPIDEHKDELLDIRDFYQADYNEKEDELLDAEQSIYDYQDDTDRDRDRDRESKNDRNQNNYKDKDQNKRDDRNDKDNKDHNNKYRQKQSHVKNGQFAQKDKFDINQKVYQEDIKLFKPNQMASLFDDQLRQKIKKFITQDKVQQYEDLHYDLLDGKISPEKFLQYFIITVGQKIGFRLLNFYLSCKSLRDKKIIQKGLEEAYIKAFKQVPRRSNNLVSQSHRYSDFFNLFITQLESSIKDRILRKDLNINKRKDVTMDKERIFQLTEILRHLKTQDMGKLKFAVNFGLSIKSLQFIRSKIFIEDINSIQELLRTIPNKEMITLYLYLSLCLKILKGMSIHQEKIEINKYVLHEFCVKNADFIAQYKDQSSESSEEEKLSLPKQNNNRKQGGGKSKKEVEQPIIVLSQYDFPTFRIFRFLIKAIKQEIKIQALKNGEKKNKGGVWENVQPVLFMEGSDNDKNIKKQIAQEFPSLENIQQQQQIKPQKPFKKQQNAYEMDESFKTLPINDTMSQIQQKQSKQVNEYDQDEIYPKNKQSQEIGTINKKGKKKIMLAGGFK